MIGTSSYNGDCAKARETATMAPKRKEKKRLGKKHRQASTRPKLGRTAPRGTATTGAGSPKKRKELAAKKAAATKAAKTPTKSPEHERKVVVRNREEAGGRGHASETPKRAPRADADTESAAEQRDWREAEALAARLTLATDVAHREPA